MCQSLQKEHGSGRLLPFCGEDFETVTHVFLDCALAKEIWAKSPFRFEIQDRNHNEFGAWCHHLFSLLDAEQRGLVMSILWGIWNSRNKWVFEKRRPDASFIGQRTTGGHSWTILARGSQNWDR